MGTKRIWLTSEESKVQAFEDAASRYGMPVSAFVGLCAWMGYRQLMRALEPESFFTPTQIVEMYQAAKERGLAVVDEDSDEFKQLMEAAGASE